jgi:hypothetical protein
MKKLSILGMAVAAFALSAVPALATGYDLDPATQGVKDQFGLSLPKMLVVGGTLVGVSVAWRFGRKILRA